MDNYTIKLSRVAEAVIDVEANSPEEAEEKAYQLYQDGEVELDRGEESDVNIEIV